MNPLKPDYKTAEVMADRLTTGLEALAGTTTAQPMMIALCYIAGQIVGTARRGYSNSDGTGDAAAYEQLYRDAYEAGLRGLEPVGPLPTQGLAS